MPVGDSLRTAGASSCRTSSFRERRLPCCSPQSPRHWGQGPRSATHLPVTRSLTPGPPREAGHQRFTWRVTRAAAAGHRLPPCGRPVPRREAGVRGKARSQEQGSAPRGETRRPDRQPELQGRSREISEAHGIRREAGRRAEARAHDLGGRRLAEARAGQQRPEPRARPTALHPRKRR